jgi:predicted RNase H-like HicB family nuclease
MNRRKKEFTVIIERDSEGWLIGTVPQLKGCHTQAKTLDKLIERIKEAILLCLEVETEHRKQLELVGIQKVAIQ